MLSANAIIARRPRLFLEIVRGHWGKRSRDDQNRTSTRSCRSNARPVKKSPGERHSKQVCHRIEGNASRDQRRRQKAHPGWSRPKFPGNLVRRLTLSAPQYYLGSALKYLRNVKSVLATTFSAWTPSLEFPQRRRYRHAGSTHGLRSMRRRLAAG